MRGLAVVAAAFLVVGVSCGRSSAVPIPLRTVGEIGLPGRTTRVAYADVDAGRDLLVVAHLGDSEVVAIDLRHRQVVWTAAHIASAHGIRIVPGRNEVLASATGSNELVALDETSGRELGRAATGAFPDGVAYDPDTKRVLVSDRDGGTVTVVDTTTFRVIGRIPVGGDVGNVQTRDGRAYAAVGSRNLLVELDPASLRVTRSIALPGCSGAHGVALDPTAPRAYVACEDNAALVTIDLDTGLALKRLRVGSQPDVLAVDPARRLLYVAAESGAVAVIALDPAPRVAGLDRYATGAHTVAVDSSLNVVAFPLADAKGHPAVRLATATKP